MCKWFKGIKTLEELKKEYKKLAKLWHPDINPEGSEAMKEINAEYEFIAKELSTGKNAQSDYDNAINYMDIIQKLVNLDGLIIELCGTWLWLSGETKKYKDYIKELGFWYAKNKKMWYLKPEGYKKGYSKKAWNMQDIRNTYGSKIINGASGYKPVLV